MAQTLRTPRYVASALARSGRPVSLRRLTDWRQKGWLPALCPRGTGRGRPIVWYWKASDIVERACCVHDTLRRKRLSSYVFWSLFFCGFSIDPKTIRQLWLKALKRRPNRKLEFGEYVADKYTDEIERLTRGVVRSQGLREFVARPFVQEAIVGQLEPVNAGRSKDEFSALATAVLQFLKDQLKLPNEMLPTPKKIQKMQELFRWFVSADAVSKLLTSSTETEMRRAHNYYRQFGKNLEALATAGERQASVTVDPLALRILVCPVFGPPVYRAFLMLLKSGNEWRLKSTLEAFSALEGHLLPPQSRLDSQQNVGLDLLSKLANIWKDLELKSLYSWA